MVPSLWLEPSEGSAVLTELRLGRVRRARRSRSLFSAILRHMYRKCTYDSRNNEPCCLPLRHHIGIDVRAFRVVLLDR